MKQPLIIMAFIVLCMLSFIFVEKSTPVQALRCDTVTVKLPKVKIYSPKEMSAMKRLYEDRKEREGFSDTVYHHKGFSYIYFGHLIKRFDTIIEHQDSAYGLQVLQNDVLKAFRYNKELYERDLYRNIKKIFIHGHK